MTCGRARRMGSVLENVERVTDAASLGYGAVSRVVVGVPESDPHHKTVRRSRRLRAAGDRGEADDYAAIWSASSMNASSRPFDRKPIV